jgi:hypothetical protein
MGLSDRVSGWAREAAKRRNAHVGVGERVELDQLVGKYSRYRRVLHDRRLVFTEKAAYFAEPGGSEATEVLPWKDVMVVELVRSVTGTCVLDILLKEAVWGMGMRTVSCDFYATEAEIWEMWTSRLSKFQEGFRFHLEVVDERSNLHSGVDVDGLAMGSGGESGGFGLSTLAPVVADDMRATMNWVRTHWSQMTRASDETKDDGRFSIAKLSTEPSARSDSVSTATFSPVSRSPATATASAKISPLRKGCSSSESVNGMADSRSTSASDMRSMETSANKEASTFLPQLPEPPLNQDVALDRFAAAAAQ